MMMIGDGKAPEPNVLVERIETGNTHLIWFLADPVHRYDTAKSVARQWPLAYFADVQASLTTLLRGDPAWNRILAHNPAFHGPLDDQYFATTYCAPRRWKLRDLATYRPPRTQAARYQHGEEPPAATISRDVYLAYLLQRFAGSPEGRYADLHAVARELNDTMIVDRFGEPLGAGRGERNDVRYAANWITRTREQWEARGWHKASFIAAARAAGRKGGDRPRVYESDADRQRAYRGETGTHGGARAGAGRRKSSVTKQAT